MKLKSRIEQIINLMNFQAEFLIKFLSFSEILQNFQSANWKSTSGSWFSDKIKNFCNISAYKDDGKCGNFTIFKESECILSDQQTFKAEIVKFIKLNTSDSFTHNKIAENLCPETFKAQIVQKLL